MRLLLLMLLSVVAIGCGGEEPEAKKAPKPVPVKVNKPVPAQVKPAKPELSEAVRLARLERWRAEERRLVAQLEEAQRVVKQPGVNAVRARQPELWQQLVDEVEKAATALKAIRVKIADEERALGIR